MIDCKTEILAPVALEPVGVWGENKNLASLSRLPRRFYTFRSKYRPRTHRIARVRKKIRLFCSLREWS